ncbi:hypothetical protein TYRP_003007 [Tyrophagus putrescentiae]|nr:hypothetical protein TYRP_003007 [Tyrophagus putrescentiae]
MAFKLISLRNEQRVEERKEGHLKDKTVVNGDQAEDAHLQEVAVGEVELVEEEGANVEEVAQVEVQADEDEADDDVHEVGHQVGADEGKGVQLANGPVGSGKSSQLSDCLREGNDQGLDIINSSILITNTLISRHNFSQLTEGTVVKVVGDEHRQDDVIEHPLNKVAAQQRQKTIKSVHVGGAQVEDGFQRRNGTVFEFLEKTPKSRAKEPLTCTRQQTDGFFRVVDTDKEVGKDGDHVKEIAVVDVRLSEGQHHQGVDGIGGNHHKEGRRIELQ